MPNVLGPGALLCSSVSQEVLGHPTHSSAVASLLQNQILQLERECDLIADRAVVLEKLFDLAVQSDDRAKIDHAQSQLSQNDANFLERERLLLTKKHDRAHLRLIQAESAGNLRGIDRARSRLKHTRLPDGLESSKDLVLLFCNCLDPPSDATGKSVPVGTQSYLAPLRPPSAPPSISTPPPLELLTPSLFRSIINQSSAPISPRSSRNYSMISQARKRALSAALLPSSSAASSLSSSSPSSSTSPSPSSSSSSCSSVSSFPQPSSQNSCRPVHRVFLIPFRRILGPTVFLDALQTQRVDVLCRCCSAAMFVSCATRGDTSLIGCLQCHEGEHITWTACGQHVRNLKPDERSIGSTLKHSLPAGPTSEPLSNRISNANIRDGPQKCAIGTSVCAETFEQAFLRLMDLPGRSLILVLSEDGQSASEALPRAFNSDPSQPPCRIIAVLGDDLGLSQDALAVLDRFKTELVYLNLGPLQQLSSHCIILLHHYLDLLCGPSPPRRTAQEINLPCLCPHE